MTRGSVPGRAGIVARWPLGIAVCSWRYMWRTTPLHRSEEAGSAADLPAGWELPAGDDSGPDRDGQQVLAAGRGPPLHRTHAVRITGAELSPAALISLVGTSLNWASPEMAVFRKTRGADSG